MLWVYALEMSIYLTGNDATKLVQTDHSTTVLDVHDCSIKVYCVLALCICPSWHGWRENRVGINTIARNLEGQKL